jgi:hypothetical protein
MIEMYMILSQHSKFLPFYCLIFGGHYTTQQQKEELSEVAVEKAKTS